MAEVKLVCTTCCSPTKSEGHTQRRGEKPAVYYFTISHNSTDVKVAIEMKECTKCNQTNKLHIFFNHIFYEEGDVLKNVW